MPDLLLLDTNVLPVWGSLDGPLWLSVRKLCELGQVEIALPEIVLRESVNLREAAYAAASAKYLESLGEVQKFFDIESVYIRDVAQVREDWEAELREVFQIVPLNGDDAVDALSREASRTRPAREGKGGRDSAIWLTAVRLASDGRAIFFVSNNTRDFGIRKTGELHPDLSAEVQTLRGNLQYFTALYAVIDDLATKISAPEVQAEDLVAALGFEFQQLALSAASERGLNPAPAFDLVSDQLEMRDLLVKNSYTIAERSLALVIGGGFVPVEDPSGVEGLSFTFKAWLDFDPEDGRVLSGEVQSLVLDEPA